MFWNIIWCLFAAWFLSLFGFDNLIINGFKELFNITITKTGYYFIWVLVAVICSTISILRGGDKYE